MFNHGGIMANANFVIGNVDGRKARHQLAQDGGMVEGQMPTSTKKRKRWAPARDPAIVNIINKTLGPNSPQPATTAAAGISSKTAHESFAEASVAAASPQTASPDMDSMLQAEIAREEPTGSLSYVHHVEKGQERHHSTNVPQEISPREGSSSLFRGYRDTVLNNPTNLLSPTPPSEQESCTQLPRKSPVARGGGLPQSDGSQPVALIDTFPRSKQRQIFGLISGIQGGIDHLQRQLILLQTSLGIELEDANVEKGI